MASHGENKMKPGDLVEMWGEPGVYGLVISKANTIDRWHVLLQSGSMIERHESLMEIVCRWV